MERDDLPPSLLVEDDLSYNMPLVTVERTCRELVRFSATESALDGSLSSLNLNVDIAASLVSQVAIAREVQWAITRATFDIQLPYGVMSIVNNLSPEISILPRLFALKSGSREWDTVAALEVILVAFKIGASGRVSWTCYTIFRFTVIRQQLFRQRVTLISIFAEVLGLVRFDHIKWTRETTCDTTSRQRSTILPRQDLNSSAIEAAGSPDFSEDLSIPSNAVPKITSEGPARRRRRRAPGHRGRRAGEHVRNYVKAAEAAAADVPNSSSADGKEEIQLEEMPQTRTTLGPSSSVSGSGSDSQQSPTSPPGRPRRSLAPSALFKNSLGSLGAQSHRA
ncbi:hypothetical protein OBBRIDRAFT_127494 [Obba rivulosa]|uniref:Uncharacterized protein n=1 Tax=Obba rivulosa TaxID=1052685 RepID=A0A8E2DH77_9APHY|nr:hypothetical protein OBBRIDRAFT_127494 [Obba rivulosa]